MKRLDARTHTPTHHEKLILITFIINNNSSNIIIITNIIIFMANTTFPWFFNPHSIQYPLPVNREPSEIEQHRVWTTQRLNHTESEPHRN